MVDGQEEQTLFGEDLVDYRLVVGQPTDSSLVRIYDFADIVSSLRLLFSD